MIHARKERWSSSFVLVVWCCALVVGFHRGDSGFHLAWLVISPLCGAAAADYLPFEFRIEFFVQSVGIGISHVR